MSLEYRTLGRSGIRVSAVAFGAGPISGLMVGDNADGQRDTVREAIDQGINWFDTAATYGAGRSESGLGGALGAHGSSHPDLCIATKVRLMPEELSGIGSAVRKSFEASLERLGVERVKLLQLHNSVTAKRGDLPTSVTVEDVLGTRGIAAAFQELCDEGRVEALGFTGLGDRASLGEVVGSGLFTSAQVPLSLLTPIAGADRSAGSVDVDYLELADDCADHDVGVIAIRVLAGGALAGQAPSPYTYKTKFFPLDLFERDTQRAAQAASALGAEVTLEEASVRYVLGIRGVTTALIGFARPDQVQQAVLSANKDPLDPETIERITRST